MHELLIKPGLAEKNYGRDLWRYRELFYLLAWRDLLVRYKQTVLGVAWAVLQPFLATLIFTVIFSRFAHLPAPAGVPYFLLVLAAQLPWQFFSAALSGASGSLIGNAHLISKVYFPRLIVPASAVITSLVDFFITLGLLAVMMAWYRFLPDARILFLPGFIALAFGLALGAGLWLCALNVEFRDVRYLIPFLLQFGLYLSPVGFTSSVVPEKWRLLYALNPLVGIMEGFRWSLLRGSVALSWPSVLISFLITTTLGLSGLWYFRKMERTFADLI